MGRFSRRSRGVETDAPRASSETKVCRGLQRAHRRSLLAGAAFAAILLGGQAASTPAGAVDQIQIPVRLITLNDIRILFNASKLNTTLGPPPINNLAVAETNGIAASNTFGPGPVGNLNQVIDGTETILFNNLISITNSGEIDPLIGIFGQINNLGVTLDNGAAAANTHGDVAPFSIGDLNQFLFFTQLNLSTNTIRETNSAKITADLFGIFAEINNVGTLSFANGVALSNANGVATAVSVGDHVQRVDVTQRNTLSNDIRVTNSGEIDPDVGIFAGINNSLIVEFANGVAASNANGDAVLVNADLLTQAMTIDSANRLANTITINNFGPIIATDAGIWAAISNSEILGFDNGFTASNANGELEAITLGDHKQTYDVEQGNHIFNSIAIDNQGNIDPDVGILATILNDDILELANSSNTVNLNAAGAGLSVGDLTQSGLYDQENIIESRIGLLNAGGVTAGAAGLRATIENSNIGQLFNSAQTSNESAAGALINFGELVQTINVDQANLLINDISVMNGGDVDASGIGIEAMIDNSTIAFLNDASAFNLFAGTVGDDLTQTMEIEQANILTNTITISNAGSVKGGTIGISAEILNSGLTFSNTISGAATSGGSVLGDVTQTANVTQSYLIASNITVANTGKIWGGDLGIFASIPDPAFTAANTGDVTLDAGTFDPTRNAEAPTSILIDNAGAIGAGSLFAIDTVFASTTIVNRSGGVITGYIDLTDRADLFDNKSGGIFEARMTSDFGLGFDLFQNAGTVHTASDRTQSETTAFVNLQRFENSGLISLFDGEAGDRFTISNTVGGTDLDYVASDGAGVGLDVFLGSPKSTKADKFFIEGNVSGRTQLHVANTNPGGGAYNPDGIPVIFVDGDVSKDAFYLDKPVDAGFYDYDLFFVPTGSGFFELRSHPGGGAHVLPRLITASHDIFHTTTETWFDRTADLRVLLNRGAPLAPNATTATGEPVPASFVPAVWVKGQGTWLNQEDKGKSTSFGRTYRYDLERDLQVMNFETGIDLGTADVLAQGDMLVFGLLGGAVLASLDYDNVERKFDIDGGEVGVYATYLRGGLFVDNLFKAHFLEIDPNEAIGFPGSVDTTTWGLRTDAGYRFGSFSHGPFIEPLATIAFAWNEMDDFVIDGHLIDFSNETNVRGRLGLRVGTSYEVWPGTLVEPFVIGSLWSNLSGDNQVKLTSDGTTFLFKDEPDEVWGVISGGVNFFNPDAQTSVFAKLDVTVGDETQGVSAKAGMRYNW
jgi:autochaperone domain-containing protein